MQLPATATLDKAADLAATLPAAVAAGTGVLRIDASALQAYDSSTIALLLQARRLARNKQQDIGALAQGRTLDGEELQPVRGERRVGLFQGSEDGQGPYLWKKSVEHEDALGAASGEHVVQRLSQRVEAVGVGDERAQVQFAARRPAEQPREVALRQAAAVKRNQIAFVPPELGQVHACGPLSPAQLHRIAAVAAQLQRKQGQRRNAGGLEGMVGAAAIGECAYRGGQPVSYTHLTLPTSDLV